MDLEPDRNNNGLGLQEAIICLYRLSFLDQQYFPALPGKVFHTSSSGSNIFSANSGPLLAPAWVILDISCIHLSARIPASG